MNASTLPNRFIVILLAALGLLLAAGAKAAPGDLDLSFGHSGSVASLFSGTTRSRVGEVVIQPDGKIVVAGGCGDAPEVICVARLLPDGQFDPTFNSGTVITTERIAPTRDAVRIVVQRDGKLVIAATCNPLSMCAIRLNPNGSRDAAFGSSGKVVMLTTQFDYTKTKAFTEQRDGKLVLAGSCGLAGEAALAPTETVQSCLARINANGSPDLSFGINGVAAVATPAAVGNGPAGVVGIDEQSDGKLVILGDCQLTVALPLQPDPCAIRFHPNGDRDTSYGVNGFASIRVSNGSYYDLAAGVMQPDGAVVIAGICHISDRSVCNARFDRNGMPDATLQRYTAPALFRGLDALHLQRDGKIIAKGRCPQNSMGSACFLRYNTDGSVDTSLPLVVQPLVVEGGTTPITTQSDGRIVVAGASGPLNAQLSNLYRYQGGPFAATQCSLDIDGDGIFNPAIDGLLLTRATLGFTGPAVYAGISFPSNALRKQWGNGGDDDIRKFLVAQCGMRLTF